MARGEGSRRAIEARTFPGDDATFRAAATEALALADDPADLQRRLRERYPAAVVRQRDPIADPGIGPDIWYAFRYGSALSGTRWWTEAGLPWAVIDAARRFVAASDSLAAIVEVPKEALFGHRIDEFSNPDDVTVLEDIEALWEQFLIAGQLHSTLRFRRADGTPRELEYHLEANGSGPGRHLAIVRELPAG